MAGEIIGPLLVDMGPSDQRHAPIEVKLVPMSHNAPMEVKLVPRPHHAQLLTQTTLVAADVLPLVTALAGTTINADPRR